MIHDPFLRRVAIALSIFFAFGFTVSGLALIIKYKPYGVSDYERPVYEAKVKHIKEVEAAVKKAKETGLKAEFFCKETAHNFGLIDPHSSVSHTFEIENRGKAPLQVLAADTSCKCTLSSVEAEWVEPGKKTTVTLTFNAGPKAELYRQYALIRTNDPSNREVELVVTGEIKAIYAADVQEINFVDLKPNIPVEKTVTVYSQLWPSFELAKIETTVDHATWETRPLEGSELEKLKASSGWQIAFRVTPTRDRRFITGTLRVFAKPEESFVSLSNKQEADTESAAGSAEDSEIARPNTSPQSETEPMAEIAVRGNLQRLLSIMGPMVYADEGIRVGLLEQGKSHEFKLPMRWRGATSVDTVHVASVKPDFVKVVIEKTQVENLPLLRIQFPEDAPETIFESNDPGLIVLAAEELPGGELRVPLRGSIRPLPKN